MMQTSVVNIVAVEDQKRIGGVEHFLVKWSASSKKDSWEPGSEVKKVAKSLIDEFQLKQKEGTVLFHKGSSI